MLPLTSDMQALVELSKIRYLLSLLSLLGLYYGIMIFMAPSLQILLSLVSWAFFPQLPNFTSLEALSFCNSRSFISNPLVACIYGHLSAHRTLFILSTGQFLRRFFE